MLTGDDAATANAVAAELGVDQVFADVLPQDKAAIVKRIQSDGEVVAMAGDGVNDAPRSLRRTSASRWAPVRTSRWSPPASRW